MSENENIGYAPEEVKEETLEAKAFVHERVKFAGDISDLLWISIVALIATVMDAFPMLGDCGKYVDIGCSVMTLGIFFCIGQLIEEYKSAGIYRVATIVIAVTTSIFGINTEDGTGVAILIAIIDAIVRFCAVYSEYQAHAAILSGIDDELAEKWNKLWTWTIIAIFGGIFGGIITGLLSALGTVIVLGVAVISVVVTITKVVYIKRMSALFKTLAEKCENTVNEEAESE